jgi:hypothetical protein
MLNVRIVVDGRPSQGNYKGLLGLVGDIEEELALALRDSDKVTLTVVVEQT